jgi:hypothetical protein
VCASPEDPRRRRVAAPDELLALGHGFEIYTGFRHELRFLLWGARKARRAPMTNERTALSRMILFAACAAGVLALDGDTAIAAGDAHDVKGKIVGGDKLVPDVYAEAAKPENHRFNWREPSPTVNAAARVLSADPSREVCVAAFAAAAQGPHDAVLVKVTGGRTIPATIVVPPKTHLSFKNFDPFPHSLFQVNEPKWAATQTGINSSRDWQAPDKPDRYEIRDALFPSLRMEVRVDPQVTGFVYPGRDGTFTLSLPAGDYTLRAYFQGNATSKDMPIHVPDKGGLDLPAPISVSGAGG